MSSPRQPVLREETERSGVRRHVPAADTGREGAVLAPSELSRALLDAALDLGCAAAGVFDVEPFDSAGHHLTSWLKQERHGTMGYLDSGSDRAAPRELLPEARSGLVVALPYAACSADEPAPSTGPSPAPRARGHVAKYAQGGDYHHHLRGLLLELADLCARHVRRPVLARPCVDTAPLLEREAAARAQLSFFGKNTMAIVPGVGSYVLLGELLLDVPLAAGVQTHQQRRRPVPREGCGSCTLCLQACPTQAFIGPYELDARRCISYLTIEYDGVIPEELRSPLGAHVFGCDVCQDVCPFNRSAQRRSAPLPLGRHPHLTAPDLIELLELTSSAYRRWVAGTALRRVSRARLARNAAVALGNVGDDRALRPLARAATTHGSALVRGHAAWALGQLLRRHPGASGAPEARRCLEQLVHEDADAWVRDEAQRALETPGAARRLPVVS